MVANIIAGGVVFVFVLVMIHLSLRITRLGNGVHGRINVIEKDWRNGQTCDAIHKGINGDIRDIKIDIRQMATDIKLLSQRRGET